jgi:hypothetical protein
MHNNDSEGRWDSLLTNEEEAKSDEEYIVPNIEFKLPKEKRQACRDILIEIRKFGVSQRQTLYLIYLLALELEDRKVMQALVKAIGDHREEVPLALSDSNQATPKIIVAKE